MVAVTHSLLIYADHQGEELWKTGAFMQCMDGRLKFKWIPSHTVAEKDWAWKYGRDFMADVVTVWEQVEAGPPSANRTALHERLPKDVPVVRFPAYSAACLWPFAGDDPRTVWNPDRYPWPDRLAAILSAETLADDELFAKYLRLTAEHMPNLDHRLELDIANWKVADAIADIALAEWVAQTFRSVSLFHTCSHITAPAIAFLMKQLLARTSILSPALERAAAIEVDSLLRDYNGQDVECVPIHPLVAQHLNLRFHDPEAKYRWHAHEWTFRQYILRYIRWADYLR